MRLGFIILSVIFLSSCINVGPASDVVVDQNEQRLVRGEYLAEAVTGCIDCHSVRQWSYFSGPIDPATRGGGGDVFDETVGLPGSITSPNITPHSLKNWTDGEIIRAIAAGVSKDGTALFPMMPYENYAHMSTEDMHSIVAYIRSLDPIENSHPKRKLNFPLGLLVRTMPKELEAPAKTPEPGSLEYGKYMSTIAGCGDCHTPRSKSGKLIMDKFMSGAPGMNIPGGIKVAPANITPHKANGIGRWTRDQFIKRFKAYDYESSESPMVPEGGENTFMPWTFYAKMTEQDLGAIFDYLQTIPAVDNEVIKYPKD